MAEQKPERELTPEEVSANVKKLDAEALRAEAMAARFSAEAKKAEAEAEAQAAETRLVVAKTEGNLYSETIARQKAEEARARELAKDQYHRTYTFSTEVNTGTVKECIEELSYWVRTAKEPQEITFIITSPGGSVTDGMILYDFLCQIQNEGHKVTTYATGHAASMGGVLLQAGHPRAMGPQAYLLIHEVAFRTFGKIGEIKDMVKLGDMMLARIADIFVTRAKETGRPKTITKARLARKWERKDWWLDADMAYNLGIVDEVW